MQTIIDFIKMLLRTIVTLLVEIGFMDKDTAESFLS